MIDRASAGHGKGEAELRREGQAFLLAFAACLRALKLYPPENEQARRAVQDLDAAGNTLFGLDRVIDLKVAGEIVFLNGIRLRLGVDTIAAYNHVISSLRQVGVGRMVIEDGIDGGEWQAAVLEILGRGEEGGEPGTAPEFQGALVSAGVGHIRVEAEIDDERAVTDQAPTERGPGVGAAKHTYETTVAVTRDVVKSVRLGRSLAIKKVKRAVQTIVDQVLNNEVSLVGLTTLRGYDEYTFTHSVNVCIFAVALGRRLGLTKSQLYDLGMAALLHDIGKSRVRVEVLNKKGGLTDDEWRELQAHPWLGVLALLSMQSQGDVPYRALIAAYEHHMKVDLSGYPQSLRPRSPNLFSKIVAVVDGFDAATSRRSYQTTPNRTDRVLKEMWANPHRGYDRVLVKELINLVGIYPVGTGVVLDTREVAVVHAAATSPESLNRPVVRIVLDPDGVVREPSELADLSQLRPDGGFARSIVRVVNLEQFGLNPVEYFT